MNIKKITAVLLVDEIEPCAEFWVERLGFAKTIEVPEGERLGFLAMQQGSVEIMYQSFASVQKDSAFLAQQYRRGPTFLYIEVDSLDELIAATKGAKVVMPERKTFYGAREIGVTDPAGHVLTFAEFGK